MIATLPSDLPEGLPDPVDTVEAGIANLREFGVTIHRGYVDADMVDRLRERVIEQAEMERQLGVANIGGPGGPQELLPCQPGDRVAHVYQILDFLPNKGRVFLDHVMNPTGLAYARAMFEPLPWRLWSTGAVISTRGLARQYPHTDEGALPTEMCTRPTLLNIFVALSDFEEDMGATLIAPGTHRLPKPWK